MSHNSLAWFCERFLPWTETLPDLVVVTCCHWSPSSLVFSSVLVGSVVSSPDYVLPLTLPSPWVIPSASLSTWVSELTPSSPLKINFPTLSPAFMVLLLPLSIYSNNGPWVTFVGAKYIIFSQITLRVISTRSVSKLSIWYQLPSLLFAYLTNMHFTPRFSSLGVVAVLVFTVPASPQVRKNLTNAEFAPNRCLKCVAVFSSMVIAVNKYVIVAVLIDSQKTL